MQFQLFEILEQINSELNSKPYDYLYTNNIIIIIIIVDLYSAKTIKYCQALYNVKLRLQ